MTKHWFCGIMRLVQKIEKQGEEMSTVCTIQKQAAKSQYIATRKFVNQLAIAQTDQNILDIYITKYGTETRLLQAIQYMIEIQIESDNNKAQIMQRVLLLAQKEQK